MNLNLVRRGLAVPAASSLTAVLAILAATTVLAQTVEVAPSSLAVQREGITGAGWAAVAGEGDSRRITLFYPNHPDDFGASTGTGTAHSSDDGITWTAGEDEWPLEKTVDLWQSRLKNGDRLAFGIRWLPDPARRREIEPGDVPTDAYRIAFSKDGREWAEEEAVIECPPEIGVIARPLPRLFEDENGTLFMPAYAWSKSGNRSLLLASGDRGRHWKVRSVVTTSAAMGEAGATVTTPWLETAVSPTSDGSFLAIIRTGSSKTADLMMARSSDAGFTWSPVEKVLVGPEHKTVAGKLPGLLLMRNGTLALLTAHTELGCRLYLSPDGTGRGWSEAHLVTAISGGNTSMVELDADRLLVFTPANRRIHCWRVTIRGTSKTVP